MTVPLIDGCVPQGYANVPASVNVRLNESPLPKSPDEKTPSTTTVCVVESSLTHTTVVPAGTVNVAGLNENPDMRTVIEAG